MVEFARSHRLVGRDQTDWVRQTVGAVQARVGARWSRSRRDDRVRRQVFVFGHQKSGTSFVASLLAQAQGVEASIDFPRERFSPSYPLVYRERERTAQLLERNRPHSQADVVKEPNLTPLGHAILSENDEAVAVCVFRDTRAILESVAVRLDWLLSEWPDPRWVPRSWRPILAADGLPVAGSSSLERLVRRVAHFNLEMERLVETRPNQAIAVRYTDFIESPGESVQSSLASLGLVADRSGELDTERSYQPGMRGLSCSERERYRLDESQFDTIARWESEQRATDLN